MDIAAPKSGGQLNALGFHFHHLGLAVRVPEAAFRMLAALGYREAPPVFDPVQRVNLALWCHHEMPTVELVWPGDEPSPVDRFVKGSGLVYHLCFVVDQLEAAIDRMEAAGFGVLPVTPPQPAVLFGGCRVCFLMTEELGLVELLEQT
jgi:catechol 2,3-dioxygenase-like lactoylglutathione lyase family enzyme